MFSFSFPTSTASTYFFGLWGCLIYFFSQRWTSAFSSSSFPLFFLSETIVMLFGCINLSFLLQGTLQSEAKRLQSDRIDPPPFSLSPLPHILLVVPTYKEPKPILQSSFLSLTQLDYSSSYLTIIISDDGARDWLRDWIRSDYLSFHYHRRESNEHAKAGNINHLLSQCTFSYDYLLLLDADMAIHPHAIHHLLKPFYQFDLDSQWIRKTNIIFVQGSQQFSNIPSLDWLGQHYHFFYQIVMNAYHGYEAGVPCCGTNVLFHYPTFVQHGGFRYGSITEDFQTSLYFHSQGFQSLYIPQTVAIGLAPFSLFDFFQQRKRWMIGGLQIIHHPSFFSQWISLPLSHKWIYLLSGILPYMSACLLLLILQPFFSFSFDHFPHISFWSYSLLYGFGLLFLLRHTSLFVSYVCISESLFMIFYNLWFMGIFIFQSLRCQSIPFYSTPKEHFTSTCKWFFQSLLLLPFLLYFIVGGLILYSKPLFSLLPHFWFTVISLQFLCPFGYSLQSFLTSHPHPHKRIL